MPRNLCVLERVGVAHGFSALDVHVLVLLAVEALDVVRLQGALAWHILDEADHRLSAVGIEASIVT